MKFPSAHNLRGLVAWQGILLAVSLLIFWSPPSTSQLTVVSTNVPEGKDVILNILNKPDNTRAFMWYKGVGENSGCLIAFTVMHLRKYTNGPAYTGREKVIFDGSLLLEDVTLNDTGDFTVVAFPQEGKVETGFGRLHVYQTVRKPILLATKTSARENVDFVILTCSTDATSIEWFFNGRRLALRKTMELAKHNTALIINPVRRKDEGFYHCEVFNDFSFYKSEPLVLYVVWE
ncbi:carcinoembryonic antigen-related cell adhesion molecule 21-like [Sturnira hondurensis]|uniref:carcinoembryonic antigen-related cell adhesion molecule 21-like n=1 Tax=Sturnira hondurensis TaxID=192404 RepID=UPI00187A39DB|nr:carcinoembryonic antigen-related cell adhesion molecule 21-like [Sturnira hondurensis]